MKTQLSTGTAERRVVSLRTSTPATGIQVDAGAGVITGAAVMTIGPAKGHGFSIDLRTLEQVRDLVNARPEGVPARFTHPKIDDDGASPETLGTDVGYVRNLRIDGACLRGDIHIMPYAEVLPGLGNVKDYLIRKAQTDPLGLGLSAVIGFDVEEAVDAQGNVTALLARVDAVEAVDFVSNPAANSRGLLSAQGGSVPNQVKTAAAKPAAQLQRKSLMEYDPKMNDALRALGLAEGASDDDAKAFFNALTDDQKGELRAKLEAAPEPDPKAAAAQMSARKRVTTDAGDEFLALEGKRVAQLQQLGNTLTVDKAVIQLAIAEGDDVTKARTRYLKALQESCKPVAGAVGSVRVGEDRKVAMLAQAIPDAILIRSNTPTFYETDAFGRIRRDGDGAAVRRKSHEMATKYAGLSVLDMYRHYLIALGAPADEVHMLSRPKLADLLGKRELRRHYPQVAQLAQSTGDFDNILLDAQNKTLQAAYVEAPRTWTIWAKRATAPDFKNINRVQLSEVPSLTARTEGKPINYVTLADSKETYALAEYAGGVILTRRVLVNDDMNAFAEVPRKQGLAAARKEEDVAYTIITANATLGATGGALFNSTTPSFTKSTGAQGTGHGNLVAGSGLVGSITVTTVAATEKLMLVQKGIQADAYIGVEPKFLIVPVALKTVAEQFVGSKVDPAKSNDVPNPYNGKFTVVANPRLDSNSATAWYLFADHRAGVAETVEVCFLQDEPEPVLKQETDFDTDDVRFAVRHTVAAKALDYRGVAKNPGA
ncbi:MAG TPA: hypothetical protein VGE74_23340 [Gemmata sp.]